MLEQYGEGNRCKSTCHDCHRCEGNTFFACSSGTGGLYYTFNPNNYDTIAITLEPDAHVVMPRGKPVLAAALLKS